MGRSFSTFLGVDLGGGKGKTTAVARLAATDGGLEVLEVATSSPDKQPWYDDRLLEYLQAHAAGAALAIDAPLTLPACVRCREPVCPGAAACVDPAIVWFRSVGVELAEAAAVADRDRIVAIPANGKAKGSTAPLAPPPRKPAVTPYTQRATEVVMYRKHGIMPRETLGQGMGPLTARAAHLVRNLARLGYQLDENLIEVYPKATIAKLWGAQIANRYKREVETWATRAQILESLSDVLEFSSRSRLARESCLQNDHCFDAVMCAYTAWLWAREGWTLPAGQREVFAVDGWIYAPGVD